MVNKPTHMSGSLINNVYIKRNLTEYLFINATVENIYCLDRDPARIEKTALDFHNIYKIQYDWARKKNLLVSYFFKVNFIHLAVHSFNY